MYLAGIIIKFLYYPPKIIKFLFLWNISKLYAYIQISLFYSYADLDFLLLESACLKYKKSSY